MLAAQKDMRIPSSLVPRCPRCGKSMALNLRSDGTFVEDAGWHAAAERYHAFVEAYGRGRILLLELGVGGNTPGIIKYPFWRMALKNKKATYACINFGEAFAPREIEARSVCLNEDIGAVLTALQHNSAAIGARARVTIFVTRARALFGLGDLERKAHGTVAINIISTYGLENICV